MAISSTPPTLALRQRSHNELTVHAIGCSTVTRDTVAEVLDLKGALNTRGKEAAERSDERRECSKYEDVELDGRNRDGTRELGPHGRDEG
jgi:hypothetical protein